MACATAQIWIQWIIAARSRHQSKKTQNLFNYKQSGLVILNIPNQIRDWHFTWELMDSAIDLVESTMSFIIATIMNNIEA